MYIIVLLIYFSSFRDSSYDGDGYSERDQDGFNLGLSAGHLADSEGDLGDSDREEEVKLWTV